MRTWSLAWCAVCTHAALAQHASALVHLLKCRYMSLCRVSLRPVLGCDSASHAQGLSLEEIEYAMGK